MKMLISAVALLILTTGCTTTVKKHTYLKYSGYMEGCVNGLIVGVLTVKPEWDYENINPVWLDTTCMDLYLKKLESEDLQLPMKRLDRNEMI